MSIRIFSLGKDYIVLSCCCYKLLPHLKYIYIYIYIYMYIYIYIYIYIFQKKNKDRLIHDYKFISVPYFQFLV